jgi:Beta propeller domain
VIARRATAVGVAFVALLAAAPTAPAKTKLTPRAFGSCAALVGYAQQHFDQTKGVTSVPVQPISSPAMPTQVSQNPAPATSGPIAPTAAPAPAATSGKADSALTPDYSTTNTQEEGVDEPDIVKTDGKTIFSIRGNTLFAVAVAKGVPALAGSLTLPDGSATGLLLRGSRLIVISATGNGGPIAVDRIAPVPQRFFSATTITEVNVSDPAAMKVARTMTIDGNFVDARQNGATARLVIASQPRAVINTTDDPDSVTDWVPMRRFRSHLTTRHYVRPVSKCQTIRHPYQFSGLGMLTILTIDLDHGLYAADSDALMADAQVVYGSTGSLYVATQRWINPNQSVDDVPSGVTTVIERFDVSDPDRTTLVSSGQVPGFLLNQFSLSEYAGYLRVATTTQPTFWNGQQSGEPSQSHVTVLDERGDKLVPVGKVSGLGTNQRLYSVRFVGDTGYVVTFRQIDPLYVIDLSEPTAPKVAGQLELEGYSSYLQPVGKGLLLGIGTAVANNRTNGVQIELFNVSDPTAPKLLQQVALGFGSTAAQYDAHALLFWPATKLAVLPVQTYTAPVFVGAIGYRLDASGIAEVGRIVHDPVSGWLPAVQRALVIGNRVFTLSNTGVMASSLDGLAPQAFAAFPYTPPVLPVPGKPLPSPPVILN